MKKYIEFIKLLWKSRRTLETVQQNLIDLNQRLSAIEEVIPLLAEMAENLKTVPQFEIDFGRAAELNASELQKELDAVEGALSSLRVSPAVGSGEVRSRARQIAKLEIHLEKLKDRAERLK